MVSEACDGRRITTRKDTAQNNPHDVSAGSVQFKVDLTPPRECPTTDQNLNTPQTSGLGSSRSTSRRRPPCRPREPARHHARRPEKFTTCFFGSYPSSRLPLLTPP